VLAASKTALLAWSAVTEDRFGTRSVPDLRGWIRRSPFLAIGLVLTAVATIGLPGWIAYDARTTLASLGAGAPWDVVLVIASVLTLPVYGRLLVVGVGQPTSRVDRAAPEWIAPAGRTWRLPGPRRGPSTVETLPVEQEGGPPTSTVEPPRGRRAASGPSVGARAQSAGQAVVVGVRRDRTQLLSAAVLTLAILAVLTSWGALDLGAAAAEPAPILNSAGTD